MLYFENDYSRGAHPTIMAALNQSNVDLLAGYGTDTFTQAASQKIKQACQLQQGQVHLLVGGTQTNAIVIASLLSVYQGVIAAETGHIAVHEAGAIEYTGHKVLALPAHQGKISAAQVEAYLETFYADQNHAHMVFPGMVYISQPTEYGTLYGYEELEALSKVCRHYQIPLYVDGARLAYALASPDNEVDLPSLAKLVDVFYYGGTKAGLLCGEAVVFCNDQVIPPHFTTMIKQHGALLAKGRLLGVQFDCLFDTDLYQTIGKEAVQTALKLQQGLLEKGYTLLLASPTNQQFVIMPNQQLERLATQVRYSFWEKYDTDHTVIRFATDWATTQSDVNQLLTLL